MTIVIFKVKPGAIVAMPSNHRLASQDTIAPQELAGEIFIGISNTAPNAPGNYG
jgi:LysR family transcriptional regulator, hca operon transcriptional activator